MEERLNAISHGIGAVLSVLGLISLIVVASEQGGLWPILSFTIYGVSLVLLYLASTLYHSFADERKKYIFKIFDHAAIYLLIAGTYTPFALVTLHGDLGWLIFGIVWALAAVGVVFQIFLVKRFKLVSTLCYVLMGWMMLIFIKPLVEALPLMGLYWLIAGGLFYTVGSVFYLVRRIPYNHSIWHVFVLAGSFSHFVAVLKYVRHVTILP